jgi:hypothetical protein
MSIWSATRAHMAGADAVGRPVGVSLRRLIGFFLLGFVELAVEVFFAVAGEGEGPFVVAPDFVQPELIIEAGDDLFVFGEVELDVLGDLAEMLDEESLKRTAHNFFKMCHV